ncbi:hypothetical protein F0562_032289 [Nyssa sinensis]|uniref:BHLH domain-containing protein n=1 Tax=Nyssa sinensis TaxID=561372 RepID=A0A5J5AR25_9ASTE|nr:hypothetical protein F0562_032289 [Nyssa sinensis]
MHSFSPPYLVSKNLPYSNQLAILSYTDRLVTYRISTAQSSSGLNSSFGVVLSSSGCYFPASATNVSSSSMETIDNDTEDFACKSDEGFEASLVKPAPSRNPLKRSRAVDVHNLSEKRRRSRIYEKMKALQNLISNSNKIDKASMLDENTLTTSAPSTGIVVDCLRQGGGFSLSWFKFREKVAAYISKWM